MNDRDGTGLMRMEGWNCTATAALFLFISFGCDMGCTEDEGADEAAVIFERLVRGTDDDSDAPPRGDDDDDRKPAP